MDQGNQPNQSTSLEAKLQEAQKAYDLLKVMNDNLRKANEKIKSDYDEMNKLLKKELQQEKDQHTLTRNGLESKLQEEKDQHMLTKDNLEIQLQKEKDQHTLTKDNLESQLQKEKDQYTLTKENLEKQLQEEKDRHTLTRNDLESQLQEEKDQHTLTKANLEIQLQKEKDLYTLTKDNLESQLNEFRTKVMTLSEVKNNVEVKPDDLPNLCIHMDSLLSLNSPDAGWKLDSKDPSKIDAMTNEKLILIGVLGMYDVGKSWFCNQLAGRAAFSSGYAQSTNSLDFMFPKTEEGHFIAIIDTPGSHEAIRVEDAKLAKLVDSVEKDKVDLDSQVSRSKDQIYFARYKKLKNDMRILNDLKERYLRETTDVLVVVCNKLSEKEQETLFKIIENHRGVNSQRFKDSQAGDKDVRETVLIVVHNYKNLTEIIQVKDQIKKDLNNSFQIEEVYMFSDKSAHKFKETNQIVYRDQFQIDHLILACNGTEAGRHYNEATFDYLKRKLDIMNHRSKFDVRKSFLEFCNTNLPKLLKHDIKLQFNEDQTAIIKDKESTNIVLKNVLYDELGNYSVLTNSFVPKYSVAEIPQESGQKKVIVEFEMINSDFKTSRKRENDGWIYLYAKGAKLKELNNEAKILKNTREFGEFELKIPITNETVLDLKREPQVDAKKELQDLKTIDGMLRFTFLCAKNEDEDC